MRNRVVRWLALQFVLVLFILTAVIAILGEIATGAAPTAVETLYPDFPVESVRIPTAAGYDVHGWLARGKYGQGAVLLVHSMRSNRLEMLGRARFLNKQGYHALLIDLQAHGETPGNRITFGARELVDVSAAVAYLRDVFPQERVAAIGTTLGAAAIVLAQPPLNLDAMVLESLHSTLSETVANRLKLHLGSLGEQLHFLLLPYFSLLLDMPVDRLNPIDQIGNIAAPVLFITGTEDKHVSRPETMHLYDAALSPKALWIVEGAGYYNMHSYAGAEYEAQIIEFLSTYLTQH